MILVIDNYDSFTWNLVDLVRRMTEECKVYRNDAITLEQVRNLRPKGILISPGPGRPNDSGVSIPIVQELHQEIPSFSISNELYGCDHVL